MTMTQNPRTATADEFAERVFEAALGALDTWSMFVGDKLGWYRLLADGPSTVAELATRSGTDRRYANEWLEQQVTTGILVVDDARLPEDERRYSLPAGHAEVLTDADSLAYLAPFVRLLTAAGIKLPEIVDAYRNGGGVSWAEFGPDMRTGQAEMNRPWFLNQLSSEWLSKVPELDERLSAGGRVADVGCGEGWSSIAIAQAYPGVEVDGFDVDPPSIEAARRHAEAAGVSDRVSFHLVDVATLGDRRAYDVVTAFECVHDMPDPVGVLAAMRAMVADDGQVVVMDEAVGEAFGDRDDEIERLMYGISLFVCLPDGRSHQPSVGTGTVMRPSVLEGYAQSAGFDSIETLPIENDLWRFYRLNLG